MQKAEKQRKFSIPAIITAVVALLIMIIAAISYHGDLPGSGFWQGVIINNFARSILGVAQWLGNSYGLGIIGFTLLIRLLILPLMIFQTDSMIRMQEVAPQLKALQAKYPSRDQASMRAMQAEQSAIYKEAGVNPFASFLPLIIQMPVLIALYQAIRTTKELQVGSFLWTQLGSNDPYFVLPLLAAAFTFASSYLVMIGQPERNTMTSSMTYIMPVVIFFMAFQLPSALSIYWVISNAFQAGQTWFIQNPFKLQADREAKKNAQRAQERAIRKAKRSRKR
ncbi:preprotein translocase subunit YidC [Weissella oryzae SG25]|uniref:Membrane protein insertase YidC n=1 Tax=Weissella oryzae (strain DSM 25784 / JCM 18191 / LMG 30913 / SG25) TaxID=1329250 RepID=A0A069CSG0_WEIOS|nr:YidC/Oxa1 family membrane protein insertase [Weissella oryzae]GAK30188.1 preprotein translocase subunit YidC [Weissella oryzae SG25]